MTTTTARRKVEIGRAVIDYNGRAQRVELDYELSPDKFAISGSVWNTTGSDITSGGQNQDTLRAALNTGQFRSFAPGWDARRLRRVLDLWDRWHLNNMKAGCVHQRAGIATGPDDPDAGTPWDERPIDPEKPTNAYGKHYDGQRSSTWNMLAWVRQDEHPRGLLSRPCPECGYRYGTAWLKEELPADVVTELESLLAS